MKDCIFNSNCCAINYCLKQGKVDSALIVAPKSVYKNWELKELPAHLPDHITADIVAWSPHKTQKKLKELSKLDEVNHNLKIFLMNIEALSTKRGYEKAAQFLTHRNTMLAIDESTTIKNSKLQSHAESWQCAGIEIFRSASFWRKETVT